jgi:hypothetical protein
MDCNTDNAHESFGQFPHFVESVQSQNMQITGAITGNNQVILCGDAADASQIREIVL